MIITHRGQQLSGAQITVLLLALIEHATGNQSDIAAFLTACDEQLDQAEEQV